MNRKNTLLYALAVVGCFLFGCGVSLLLSALDSRAIQPLEGGQTLDFSAFGFTMQAPQESVLRDHTLENSQKGGSALYAGSINCEEGTLYLFCYENETGDNLSQYGEQDVVSYYMSAGATDVRTREFGGRRFICYRASAQGELGEERWDTYETWDERLQISFETRMAPSSVLPLLASIEFTAR